MPELRRDPVIDRWVIIATERAKRPDQFGVSKHETDLNPGEACPFCEGNEHMTPPEIYSIRKKGTAPNGPGWATRVIPSATPFLRVEGGLDRRGKGMYDLMNARGAHEVIIETPRHIKEHQLPAEQVAKVLNTIVDRFEDLKNDSWIRYILMFKNYGAAAGGGHIVHSRSQLIGTPATPKRVKEELNGARKYYDYKERCIFCDIINQEFEVNKRVIAQVEDFVALAPYASRFPFELWILPLKHSCDFHRIDRASIPHLANLMHKVFEKLRRALGDFPYNLILHTAPLRNYSKKGYWSSMEHDYHWHFELIPVLTRVAGFEWGSGFYINPMPPESACDFLKGIKV
ncbi:DUF4931 domain-containing protein [Candidatus Omnitrophota bacterium]